MSKRNRMFLMASLGGLFAALSAAALSDQSASAGIPASGMRQTVENVLRAHNLAVDPDMILAMIQIESSGNPKAVRYEAHLDDVSVGLMQTLGSTARWLAEDLGYTAYGLPSNDDLLSPEVSIYFGAAYVQWLSTYRGERRSEQWIVESYNGGPGNSNSQTQNHYRKYLKAKEGV